MTHEALQGGPALIFRPALATVLTLGVVPTLYSVIDNLRTRFKTSWSL